MVKKWKLTWPKRVDLLDPKGSRRMPPPRLQIYFQPRVTLTFDPVIPKVGRFMPLPVDHLCRMESQLVRSFSKYRVHNLVTDEQTDTLRTQCSACMSACLSACLSGLQQALKLAASSLSVHISAETSAQHNPSNAPFIATQLNSTRRWVELSWVASL